MDRESWFFGKLFGHHDRVGRYRGGTRYLAVLRNAVFTLAVEIPKRADWRDRHATPRCFRRF